MRLLVVLALAATCSGCALTSKSEPIEPRYFSPERSFPARSAARPASAVGELRVGHVSSTSYLDERMVFRDSPEEVGYYLERRWTEAPEHYLKRRLAHVLFEERGVQQVVGGSAATLEVELTAFEEIRGAAPVARAQVIVRLHDQRIVRWEETLTADQPITAKTPGDASATVDALAIALATLVDRIADRTLKELATATPEPAPVLVGPTTRRR